MGCWIAHTIWHNSCHPCSLDTLQLIADLCTTADGLPDGSGSPRRRRSGLQADSRNCCWACTAADSPN